MLLIGGILVVSFNLRAAITSLPPVFPELKHAAGLSTATLAALAAVPVLSFAVFSGLAPVLARQDRRGAGASSWPWSCSRPGSGCARPRPACCCSPARSWPRGAIALVNVLLPSLVKRRKPELAGLLIGLYLMSLTAGAVLAAVIAVPVFNAARRVGPAVRLTLGMWAVPALIAAAASGCRRCGSARGRTRPAAARGVLAWPGTGWPGRS